MAIKTAGKGLDEVLKNLNKEINKIEGDVQAGLIVGGALIKGHSQGECPVDLGNLRASAYLVAGNGQVEAESSFELSRRGKPDKGAERVAAEHSGHIQSAASEAKSKGYPFIELGYTAFYAEAVHEDPTAYHPSGKYKFLEDPIKKDANMVLELVKKKAKR